MIDDQKHLFDLRYMYTMKQLTDMGNALLLETYAKALLFYNNEDVYFILSNIKYEIMDRIEFGPPGGKRNDCRVMD